MDFTDFLETLDDGDVSRRLADELGQVVRAARRTGRPGELNLKLTFRPDGRTVVTTSAITSTVSAVAVRRCHRRPRLDSALNACCSRNGASRMPTPLWSLMTPPASIAWTNSARVAKGKSSPPQRPSRWA